MKLLNLTLTSLIAATVAGQAVAQDKALAAAQSNLAQQAQNCEGFACRTDEGLLFQVRTRGEEMPVAPGTSSKALQENRRVDVMGTQAMTPAAKPGNAKLAGKFVIDLPNGGVIWATEDPTIGERRLSVQGGSIVPFENGRITKPVRFHSYTNYAAFIEKLDVTIYRGSDSDMVTPLATLSIPVANVSDLEWDGTLPSNIKLQAGDDLVYIARAYGKTGVYDETIQQRIQLVRPADYLRGVQVERDETQRTLGKSLDTDQAQSEKIERSIYGSSTLRTQNIPVYGSRVRIYGRDIPEKAQLEINGQSFPVDLERKFAAEFLEPVGKHGYDVAVKSNNGPAANYRLDVDVTGKYSFLVAMADATVTRNSVSGSIEPLSADDRYDQDFISDGRLAFYLKGKVKGKYLITAQADTQEREIKNMFDGFFKADPQDVFRRLDPDLYYPVYGDDSSTYRDVDTQGRLYVRIDWDQNQALWGNFNTGLTGTEYGQYNRSLYGAALSWRSNSTTALGEPKSELRGFGSEAQSAFGHTELLGTGGSLYYLKHTDILPGSDKVTLEIRDQTTGRTENRVVLQRGADYEIDELQGRLILTRPLSQITRENSRTLTRDTSLDGYSQLLQADYEYVPTGFQADNTSVGVRGKQWLGDHLAVGGTYVDENRSGDDYTLKGADITLQAGRGTYLKAETTLSKATAAPIFHSNNGGLNFTQINPSTDARDGEATAVEGRINFKELGYTQNEWSTGAWWRNVDSGFSVSRFDIGENIEEYGVEFLGYFSERFSLYGRYTRAERGSDALEQAQLTTDWRITDSSQFGAELRRVGEERTGGDIDALLAALSYRYRFGSSLELYGIGQVTADDDGGKYPANNRVTVGSQYSFGERSNLGAELSGGSRGGSATATAEYHVNSDSTVYGGYTYSTDKEKPDALFNNDRQSGWTLGQRSRVSNMVSVFNESQYLKDPYSGALGLVNTFGLDLYPAEGWSSGFTIMAGKLDTEAGQVNRRAYSVSAGRTDPNTQWLSKVEFRKDTGAEQRRQWLTTNRVFQKVNEDLRLALRADYSDTKDEVDAMQSARLAEANVGFAYRPHDSTRWGLFGKYTYLYDLATIDQIGGATYDQRTQVLALEGIYHPFNKWEFAGKLASRIGDYRMGRGEGAWLNSRADFAALQVRYHLLFKWEGLAEYRVLDVKEGGLRHGWLVGLDRQLGENFKVGLGYNFTGFSDDMTKLEYDQRGVFLNFTGYY